MTDSTTYDTAWRLRFLRKLRLIARLYVASAIAVWTVVIVWPSNGNAGFVLAIWTTMWSVALYGLVAWCVRWVEKNS